MLDYIKKHGVIQLLNIYNERKDWNYRVLLWGDEIEYLVIKVDPAARSAKLSLRGHELLPVLQEPERDNPSTAASLWRPEYGRSVARRRPLVRSTHCFSSARWRLRFCVTLSVLHADVAWNPFSNSLAPRMRRRQYRRRRFSD